MTTSELPLAPQATRDLDHLPGDDGWPFLGYTVEVLYDNPGLTRRLYERYGPLFRTQSFFEHHVILIGPELADQLLTDRERNFSSELGWSHFLGRLFQRGLMLRDFEDHRFHRRIMQEAFRKPAMEAYLEDMAPHIRTTLERWGWEGRILFQPAVKELTLEVAVAVFLGLELGAASAAVNRSFVRMLEAVTAVLPEGVPGSKLWQGMRARRFLYDFLSDLLPEKRAGSGRDMFSQLAHATTEDGESFSDDEVIDHMIFLLFAAHDTTTSGLAALAYRLGRHPEWQDRLAAEAASLETLTHADLGRLAENEWAFKEALRLHPPVGSIVRRTVRECEIQGHRIPANTTMAINVGLTHRLEEWWTRPNDFDPERFSDERAEHRRHRFSYIPFGGGAHMCLGIHFAYMEVKAILHQLMRDYRLVLPEGYRPKYRVLPMPRFADGLPMRIKPR